MRISRATGSVLLFVGALLLVTALLVAAGSAWRANENVHDLLRQRTADRADADADARAAAAERDQLARRLAEVQRENRAVKRFLREQGIPLPPAAQPHRTAPPSSAELPLLGASQGQQQGHVPPSPRPTGGPPSHSPSPTHSPTPRPTPTPPPSGFCLPVLTRVCIPMP